MSKEIIAVLGKMDILKCTELKKELVSVPEWGGSVWVQEMSGKTRDTFDRWVNDSENSLGFRVRILIATIIDEKGKPVFTDLDIGDLHKKSGQVINRLSEKGMDLSGMGDEAEEDVIKNSGNDLKEDLSSDSVKS